ncbi:hypothetical protein LENED_008670 [Lentinula edodes]|uniref:Uncharacterized protein n=1 Tax=Lentinula edodes TaxID=5353 RepID=A0A1Q3EHR4_LENED|nr:hypothetical protein LENED_008670 [Lentinula edodes]
MSLRRAASLASVYSKARSIAQLSRRVAELEEQLSLRGQALEHAELGLDELMNSENQRIQFLEDERKQVFNKNTEAEIRVERYKRRVDELEAELEELQAKSNDVKIELEVKAEGLQRRVDELEAELQELRAAREDMNTSVRDCSGLLLNAEVVVSAEGMQQQSLGISHAEEILPVGITINPDLEATMKNQSCGTASTADAEVAVLQQSCEETADPSDPPVEDGTAVRPERFKPGEVDSNFKIKKLEYPEDALRSKNATQWFPAAFQYLNQDLGQDYAALIESWVTLERCKNWAYSAKGIAAKNRPKELSYWITNCRYNRPGNDPRLQEDDLALNMM